MLLADAVFEASGVEPPPPGTSAALTHRLHVASADSEGPLAMDVEGAPNTAIAVASARGRLMIPS
jgi:hypothetical protein